KMQNATSEKLKTKMQNDKSKFKKEFRGRVYRFALDVIEFIEQLPKGQVSNIIGDQLLRSATSIGANVIEAQGASSRKDYTNFFAHALKSANETEFWLCLLRDSGKAERERTENLLREVIELSKILATSIMTLKGKG
ncbi:MAG: four helix bundle protein, partial [Chloroflexi bacterium]|nr:four helix bundle protein [Chloroflexota bacterium]